MKIACITTSKVPSDTANSIQVMKVCQALAQVGHDVNLIVPGETTVKWEKLAEHYGLDTSFKTNWISEWRVLRRYDFALKSAALAGRMKAQLIYTWLPQAALFGRLSGKQTILEIHDRPTGKIGPLLLRRFTRLKGWKRSLVITQALRHSLEVDYGCRFDRGEVVISPNGIDMQRYQNLPAAPAARRQLHLPERPTIGYTGHFYVGRGTELLLALARLFPQVSFLFVGGRPADVEHLRQVITGAGLGNVHLTGFVENRVIPMYQAAADILLMPYEQVIQGSSGGNSADICSPMKMFEYMAAGRAIVTSDLPIIREVLNESSAVFCPPGDVTAWQQAIRRLLEDTGFREGLARKALQDVQQYTWQSRAVRSLEGIS